MIGKRFWILSVLVAVVFCVLVGVVGGQALLI